jgi:hypothetical protein
MAQVHNLVGTSRIFSKLHKLDLRAISSLLPNAYLEEQKSVRHCFSRYVVNRRLCSSLLCFMNSSGCDPRP